MSHYARLLRHNPDFARLWLAQVVSLLGDWFNTIVLSTLVAEYSGGSGVAVSVFLLARFVPPLLISPLAGVLVDRFDRKRLLILSDLGRAVVVLCLLFANSPDLLWLIYVLTIVQFSISAVFEPGRNAIMPSLLRQQDLVIANTLSGVTWSAMLAIGAIAGGLVAGQFGTAVALTIDAASFLLSALLITRIRLHPEYQLESEETGSEAKSQQGFRDGLRYARQHPNVLAALMVKLGQSLGNVDALMIIYATELFVLGEKGATSLSIMYAAFGFGAVIGPVLMNRLNDGSVRVMRRLIIGGYVAITFGWALLSGASTLPLVALALVMRAIGGSVNWTYSSVILQKSVQDSFLGRIFSLDMAGFYFTSIISTVVTGTLTDALGVENVRQIVIGTGLVSLAPLLLWIVVVSWLERREAHPVPAGGG